MSANCSTVCEGESQTTPLAKRMVTMSLELTYVYKCILYMAKLVEASKSFLNIALEAEIWAHL